MTRTIGPQTCPRDLFLRKPWTINSTHFRGGTSQRAVTRKGHCLPGRGTERHQALRSAAGRPLRGMDGDHVRSSTPARVGGWGRRGRPCACTCVHVCTRVRVQPAACSPSSVTVSFPGAELTSVPHPPLWPGACGQGQPPEEAREVGRRDVAHESSLPSPLSGQTPETPGSSPATRREEPESLHSCGEQNPRLLVPASPQHREIKHLC